MKARVSVGGIQEINIHGISLEELERLNKARVLFDVYKPSLDSNKYGESIVPRAKLNIGDFIIHIFFD